MRSVRAAYVSPGIVTLSGKALGFGEGLTVRDPDGHAIELVSQP